MSNMENEPGYYKSNIITEDAPVIITTTDLPKIPQTESEPLPLQQRVFNTQYLQTFPGILKLIQLVFGLISIILVAVGFKKDYALYIASDTLFLVLVIAAFYITSCLLFANVIPMKSGKILPTPKHELIYHWIISILMFALSIVFLAESGGYYYSTNAAGGAFGIINSIVYLAHTYLSYTSI